MHKRRDDRVSLLLLCHGGKRFMKAILKNHGKNEVGSRERIKSSHCLLSGFVARRLKL
jgi:hypothetical protein